MYLVDALATVENNHIEANRASYQGGGVLCSSWLSPLIGGNTITNNRAGSYGGGICCIETELGPYITGNTIAGNTALDGGGIYCDHSRPDITHNVIDHNRAEDDGGGIACINQPSAMIGSNSIVYNRANPQGGGIYCQDSTPLITNCILWGNGDDLHVYARNTTVCELNVTYSLVEDGQQGEGNISLAPYFVAPNGQGIGGDYHLRPFSPGIDAGNPASDFAREPVPNGGRIDMGAYGNTTEASSKGADGDGDGMPDDWEAANGLNPNDGSDGGQDADRDGATNLREYEAGTNPDLAYEGASASVYVSHVNADDPAADGTLVHPFSSIQRAVDVARPGGFIRVTNGVFHERLFVDGKALTLEGGYDPTFATVTDQKTTVNADRQGRSFTLTNVPDGFVLENFVATGAQERDGGGIYILGSEPEIRNCEIVDNRVIDDGAGIFAFNSAPRIIDCTVRGNESGGSAALYFRNSGGTVTQCLISGNTADHSTGIQLSTSTVRISDCRIENNLARSTGGGLVCRRGSTLILDDSSVMNNQAQGPPETSYGGVEVFEGSTGILRGFCEITGNGPHGVLAEGSSTIVVEGMVDIDSNDWMARDAEFLDGGGVLWMGSAARLCVDQCSISCGIFGPGTIRIDRDGESILAGNAYINIGKDGSISCQGRLRVKDDAKILGTGTISIVLPGELVLEGAAQIHSSTLVCDGLLRVKDNAAILDSSIIVSRASFEGNAHIESNTISAQAAAPYGQFFIEGTVSVSGNTIHADGDRYMDLDPSTFNGLITNNRIIVTIPKDTGQARSGMLELRGQPGLANGGTQDLDNPFLWKVNAVPGFNTDNWMIDALVLDDHAKLNLTNRFDFHVPFDLDGHEEVLYVRNLKLGAGAVLNTAFNRIYYETLEVDPTAVINNIPLLGFSLSNIAFNDGLEYLIRVTNNNRVCPDNPFYDRIHVERVTGLAPDRDGMMRMKNQTDTDPDSPAYGQVIHARAKGLFARVIEPEVLIQFEYVFESSDPGIELDIFLSDCPEMLAEGHPGRVSCYRKVGTLLPPLPGQPGAEGSGRFGIYSQSVNRGNLNFIRGTRIEFELRGPEGASVLINNWDPLVVTCESTICKEVNGDGAVDIGDLYTIIQEFGKPTSKGLECFEGPFRRNGRVDMEDVEGMCWFLSPDNKGGACDNIFRTGPRGPLASGSMPPPPSGSTDFSIPENNLLLSGLQGITEGYRLFMFNDLGQYQTWFDPAFPQSNGRLVLDSENTVWQIQMTHGLVGFSDSNSLIPPAIFEDILEPRYKTLGRVQVGLQMVNLPTNEILTFGLPLSDAAFDREKYVYVVPVVVEPNLADPGRAYLASAKLELLPDSIPPYRIVQLYDDSDAGNDRDNRNLNGLREIEVDSWGNVYVLNNDSMNDSDTIWEYDSATGEMIGTPESLSDSSGPAIPSPTAMHVSTTTGLVYLAALSDPDAGCSNIYGLSLEDFSLRRTILIRDMHHITGISEDPATGRLWVTGFSMRDIPEYLDQVVEPFYHPYLARIEPSQSEVTAFPLDQTGTEEGNNLSLPLSVLWVGPTACDRADLNQDGIVNFPDFALMAEEWVSTDTIEDLRNLARHWLEDCR